MYDRNISSVCGKFMHISPPKHHPDFQNVHSVHSRMSMEVLKTVSRDLVAAALVTDNARKRMRAAMPHYQEDTSVGSLIYEESIKKRLPITYYSLKPWSYNRFWVDFRDQNTLPDKYVSHVHRVYDARIADVAVARITNDLHYAFRCVECKEWGLLNLSYTSNCCSSFKLGRQLRRTTSFPYHSNL